MPVKWVPTTFGSLKPGDVFRTWSVSTYQKVMESYAIPGSAKTSFNAVSVDEAVEYGLEAVATVHFFDIHDEVRVRTESAPKGQTMTSDPRKVNADRVGSISVNKQFWYRDKRYVRIPEMILECGEHGFMVNAIRVEAASDPDYESPTLIAECFHPDTVVELVKE
jgi:hypothetical protein